MNTMAPFSTPITTGFWRKKVEEPRFTSDHKLPPGKTNKIAWKILEGKWKPEMRAPSALRRPTSRKWIDHCLRKWVCMCLCCQANCMCIWKRQTAGHRSQPKRSKPKLRSSHKPAHMDAGEKWVPKMEPWWKHGLNPVKMLTHTLGSRPTRALPAKSREISSPSSWDKSGRDPFRGPWDQRCREGAESRSWNRGRCECWKRSQAKVLDRSGSLPRRVAKARGLQRSGLCGRWGWAGVEVPGITWSPWPACPRAQAHATVSQKGTPTNEATNQPAKQPTNQFN